MKCSIDGCDRASKHPPAATPRSQWSGVCNMHSRRIEKYGTPSPYTDMQCRVCGEQIPDDFRGGHRRVICDSNDCRRSDNNRKTRESHAAHRSDPAWLAQKAAESKAWRKANPGSWKAHARKRALKGAYKMTLEQYDDLLATQGGGCAICGRTTADRAGRRLHVDHDHSCCPGSRSCGKCVRGLLCKGCNTALGCMEDDLARMYAAVRYLAGVRHAGGPLTDRETPWQTNSPTSTPY